MRETGFWRSPSMLSTWWRRRRPRPAQPGREQRRLRTLAAMTLPATFEELVLPCAIIATNLTRARKEIFTTGSVPDAVAASAAIPGLFNPYRIGNEEFVDGAVAENVGLPEAIQLGATHIAAIDNSTSNPRRPPNHTLTGILAQSIQIMLGQRMLEEYQRYAGEAEICLMFPNVEFGTAGTDFSQVDRLIDEAYARTRGFLQAGGLDRRGPPRPGVHQILPPRPPPPLPLVPREPPRPRPGAPPGGARGTAR